jgi:hypothetical protein
MAITYRISTTPIKAIRGDKGKPKFPVYVTVHGVEVQIGWTYGEESLNGRVSK